MKDIDRYKRQIIVDELGEKGQRRLKKSKVLIIGAGGIGSNTANILTRMGIGSITIVDHDIVDITNLHRTSIFSETDVDKPKSTILSEKLKLINSQVEIKGEQLKITKNTINQLTEKYKPDIIIDGTDNIETRYLINEVAIKYDKPWVYAGVHGTIGMVLGIIPHKTSCLRCFSSGLFHKTKQDTPVIGFLTVTTAAIQTSEVIKILTGDEPSGLIIYDTWNQCFEKINIKPNPKCTCCSKKG
ncbi:MAG: HesA/MoeB/ThiF family protein [Candidatus Thermoplasmatota archaeon]